MIFGPFLCSTTFTITNNHDLRCLGYSSTSSTARKRKRQNSTFLFLVFIDHRFPRFGCKYRALLFRFSLPRSLRIFEYEWDCALFFDFAAATLPYREYEQVSALFLSDPAILSRAGKRLPTSFLCSAARPTELRIAVILSQESLIA